MKTFEPSPASKYVNIRALYEMQASGATFEELKAAAIETAQTARTSYEKKQVILFMKEAEKMNKKEKPTARAEYKQIRDASPANDKQTRRYWNSRYITAPNHAGLYIESIRPDHLSPYQFKLKQIARDSRQPISRDSFNGLYPYINSIPDAQTGLSWYITEWDARQALKLFTAAYDTAGARELYVWHNSHAFMISDDTPGIITVWADSWKNSADIDTDPERNQKGARLWSN